MDKTPLKAALAHALRSAPRLEKNAHFSLLLDEVAFACVFVVSFIF